MDKEAYDSQSEVNLDYTGRFYLKTKKQPDMRMYDFHPSSQGAEAKVEMEQEASG